MSLHADVLPYGEVFSFMARVLHKTHAQLSCLWYLQQQCAMQVNDKAEYFSRPGGPHYPV